MKMLVTGGAGFVGSHVVDAYVAAGQQVIVVDDLCTGKRGWVNPLARLVQMDIGDPALVALCQAERLDAVNHHAGNASVARLVRQPGFDAKQRVLGTLHVLEAARMAGVGKFIHVSSGGAMYGEPKRLPMDEGHPPDSCQCLSDGTSPEVHWDGEQTRDFVYVGDCVRANLLALQSGDGQAYNVGTGLGTSINSLFWLLVEVTGREMAPRHGPRRPGDIRHSYLDCGKAGRELGWRAEVSLRDGLERTWEFFQRSGPARHGRLPESTIASKETQS